MFSRTQKPDIFLKPSSKCNFQHFNIGDDQKGNKWWIQTTFGHYPLDGQSFQLLCSHDKQVFVVCQDEKVMVVNFHSRTFKLLEGDVYTHNNTIYFVVNKHLFVLIGYRNNYIKRVTLLDQDENVLYIVTIKGRIGVSQIVRLIYLKLRLNKLLLN